MSSPEISEILGLTQNLLGSAYKVRFADGTTGELSNPLVYGCTRDVWKAYWAKIFRESTMTNEQVHRSLGIASRWNPDGGPH